MKGFNWLAADLHMLLIYGLKFNLPSNWIPKSSTKGAVLICLLSITKFSFVWSQIILSIIITWNLSGFTIIWFFLNHSVITSDSLCKSLINFDAFSAKAGNVLSSSKLCTDAINMKKCLLIDWTKEDPVKIPDGHPWLYFQTHCKYH